MQGQVASRISLLASRSTAGRQRSCNEDAIGVFPDLGLWVIADGMGGAALGGLASETAVRVIAAAVREETSLEESALMAHRALLAIPQPPGEARMGATMVAVQAAGRDYEIAWVGDSRAYCCSGRLQRLTKDHSYVQRLIDAGKITEITARRHPKRSTITQAIGAPGAEPRPGLLRGTLAKGEMILLCSDGLTRELEDNEIMAVLGSHDCPQIRVDRLVAAANARGGHDNISVVLLGGAVEG